MNSLPQITGEFIGSKLTLTPAEGGAIATRPPALLRIPRHFQISFAAYRPLSLFPNDLDITLPINHTGGSPRVQFLIFHWCAQLQIIIEKFYFPGERILSAAGGTRPPILRYQLEISRGKVTTGVVMMNERAD